MALLPDVFKPDEVQDDPFAPIPAGWYLATIVKSEVKDTNDKTGKYISLQFKIVEGDYEGRFIFSNINIVNKSDVAVKIGQADLKAICEAIGLDNLEDTVDMHNEEMCIKVSVKPETPQWPAKNEVKGYKPASEYADMA